MRLFLQRTGGRRRRFHQRRVLLGHLVHLRDGLVDLIKAAALRACQILSRVKSGLAAGAIRL